MKTITLDLLKLADWVVDLIEHHVCDDKKMHQSFGIQQKEEIKKCVRNHFIDLRSKYDLIELDLKVSNEEEKS